MPNEKLDKVKAVLGLLDDGKPTAAQLETFLSSVLKLIKDAQKALSDRVDNALDSLTNKIDAKLASITQPKDGYTPIKGKDYFDGKPGYTPQKGVDYFDGKDADPLDEQAAIERIERDIPRLGEPIRDSLELLQGDERLDASAIKNLPEATRQIVHAAGHNSLWTLADVNVAGIQPGQSLTWNGIFWEPYTPAGGGGTPVYGEDLTPQGPGSSFTLADTPIAGTVRLYRGGSYQSVPNGDYSITGDTIALTSALQVGETLVCDYTSA